MSMNETTPASIEIEGKWINPNNMGAKITLTPTYAEEPKIINMTCGEYFSEVTEDGNRDLCSHFICYHFRIKGHPIASIKKFEHNRDATLIERFNMFFHINDEDHFKTMIEKHDFKTVIKGGTLTDRYNSINTKLSKDIFEMVDPESMSSFDIHSDSINYVYTETQDKTKTKYTIDGYQQFSNIPTVTVKYNDDTSPSSVIVSRRNKNGYECASIDYDRDGNEHVLRLPNSTTITAKTIPYMYNTSTTIVKIKSATIPESTSVLTSGIIGFINADGFTPHIVVSNSYRRKDMVTLTNKVINDIPSDILTHIFKERNSALTVTHISIDDADYYHVHYNIDTDSRVWPFAQYDGARVSYDAVYNAIQDNLIYRSYSYKKCDGDHIFEEEYYRDFSFIKNPQPKYKITHTWNDDHSKTIINFESEKIEREVTYTDKSDRSKMKFKIKVENGLCYFAAICNTLDIMMSGEFDLTDYLKAVDINIDYGRNMNMFTSDPKEFYDFYTTLIDLVSIPTLTEPSKMRRPPECVIKLPYSSDRYNAIEYKIDTLLDPANAFNWIGWFNNYKMNFILPASNIDNFTNIDFKSFILPKEKAAAILKKRREKLKEREKNAEETFNNKDEGVDTGVTINLGPESDIVAVDLNKAETGLETLGMKLIKEGDDESDGNVT